MRCQWLFKQKKDSVAPFKNVAKTECSLEKKPIFVLLSLSGMAVIGTLFLLLNTQERPDSDSPGFEITELRDTYKQGDVVTISVNYDGKKFDCHTPTIVVTNKTNHVFARNGGEQIKNGECPDTWGISFYPGSYAEHTFSIEHSKSYLASVSLGGKTIQKEFTVYPDPDRKFYLDIQVNNLDRQYRAGDVLNFTISIRGYGVLDDGEQPQVQILDGHGSTIWSSQQHVVLCCPIELTEISQDVPLSSLGDPLKIDLAGTYTINVTFAGNTIQKSFEVILPQTNCKEISKTDSNIKLKKYTWIAVSQIRQPFKTDCIDAENIISDTPKLAQAIRGADGCQDGTTLCTIPKGVTSYTLVSDTYLVATDFEQYKMTLSDSEAQSIAKKLGITPQNATPHTVLKYNDKLYLLFFYTMDESPDPEAVMEFDTPTSYVPVKLEKGQSINYTMTVKTLATFGQPKVGIDFSAGTSPPDSLLDVKVEPSHLEMGERQRSHVNMIISASKDTRDGIYQTWVGGNVGDAHIGPWSMDFPIIQVGDSNWRIYGQGGGIGGKEPPSLTIAEIKTDKSVYFSGETVQITSFIKNNATQEIVLDNPELMVQVYNQTDAGTYQYYYGVTARYDGKITIKPDSDTTLARPFYWDQQMAPGKYGLYLSLSGYNGTVWHDDKWIEIKTRDKN